jgi:hypothetical protein
MQLIIGLIYFIVGVKGLELTINAYMNPEIGELFGEWTKR